MTNPIPASGTLPVLICFVDTERRYRFNNGAWVDWFGLPPSSLAGKPVIEVIGEQRYQNVSPFIDQALAGKQVAFETLIPTADGRLRYGQVVYVPQTGADGKLSGFYALVTDITEWKRSQQAAKDSQALYQSLVDHLPMCILRKDREGRFTFANNEFYRYSGKSEAELVGKTDFDFYPHELASKYHRDDLKVLEAGETFSDIEAHRTPAGEQKYVQVLKGPIHDAAGQIIGVQILFWDVSDRKLAEEQVRESMARKRAIFDAALDSIVVADQEGRIIDFNRAAEKTFGYRRDDVLGQNMDELLFPKETRRRAQENRERYERLHEEGSMIGHRLESVAVRKNGEVFDVETAMQAIPLEGKTVFAIFLQDITIQTHIGVPASERATEQTMHVSVELFHGLDKVGTSDDVRLGIDYQSVTEEILSLAKTERKTVERFAEDVAAALIKKFKPEGGVKITVKKTPPLPLASASVTIQRP